MSRSTVLTAVALALLLTAAIAQAGWEEGVAAFKAGKYDTAAKEFGAIVESQPEWGGGHFMLGWTYLKQQKNREAITHLRKAFELNPKDANVQLRLGEAYVASGRYSDAAAFLSKIDESALPKNLHAFLAQLRAVALTKTGQDDAALAQFRKAADASPDDARAQYQYGTAAYNAGDTATAVRALEKATRLDPKDADKQSAYAKALNRLGRETRGDAKMDAYRKAARAAQVVVSSKANFDNVMLLGEAQLGAKMYDQAIESFNRASGLKTNDWLPDFYVGQAYTAKQQLRSAEQALKIALDKTGDATAKKKIWRQLGFVYEKQKKFDEAILAYRQAGDSAGAQRAEENRQIAEYNKDVEQENEAIRRLEAEQERIRKELEELPGGPPPNF